MAAAVPVALVLLLSFALLGAGCAVPGTLLAAPAAQATPHRIHVVSHGWHSGIVVRAADVPATA